MSTPKPICAPFQGNSDLYGLGIRIGIYLQWFSSWLCMTSNPESAQDLHSGNSIFVFAVIIAAFVAVASSDNNLRPVEAYIMIQFCFGYLFTVLSIFGLRLQCMTPNRLAQLLTQLRAQLGRIRSTIMSWNKLQDESLPRTSSLRKAFKEVLLASLAQPPRALAELATYHRVDSIGFIKSGNLTWLGVQWRVAIASLVAIFNVWLWFHGLNSLDTADDCDSYAFMFSRQRLRGGVVTLFQIGAICYMVCIGIAFLTFMSLTLNCLEYIYRCYLHHMLFSGLRKYGLLKTFQTKISHLASRLDEISRHPMAYILISRSSWPAAAYQLMRALLELMSQDEKDIPLASDLLQAYAILASKRNGAEQGEEQAHGAQNKTTPNRLHLLLSLTWHAWTGASIIWFILCVELTISWNNITGVHNIRTTGQLIPFITGVVTSIRTANQVILFLIKKKYPTWNSKSIEVSYKWFGQEFIIRVHRDQGETTAAAPPDHTSALGSTTQGVPLQVL